MEGKFMKKILLLSSAMLVIASNANAHFSTLLEFMGITPTTSPAAQQLVQALNAFDPDARQAKERLEQAFTDTKRDSLTGKNDQKVIANAVNKANKKIAATANFTPMQATTTWLYGAATSPFLYVAAACGITGYAIKNGYITKDMVAPYVDTKLLASAVPLSVIAVKAATAGTALHATYKTYDAYKYVRIHKEHFQMFSKLDQDRVNKAFATLYPVNK